MKKWIMAVVVVVAFAVGNLSTGSIVQASIPASGYSTTHPIGNTSVTYYNDSVSPWAGSGSPLATKYHQFTTHKSGTVYFTYSTLPGNPGSSANLGVQVLDSNYNVLGNGSTAVQVQANQIYYIKVYYIFPAPTNAQTIPYVYGATYVGG